MNSHMKYIHTGNKQKNMNGKIQYVITYHYMYRQIMITFGWCLLVTAVQETC